MNRMKIVAVAAILAGSSTFAMAQQAGGGGGSQGPSNVDMYEAFKGPNPSPSDARNSVGGYYGRLGPAQGYGYNMDSGMSMGEPVSGGIVDERYEVIEGDATLRQERRVQRNGRMSDGRRAPITAR